jgi:hypothetical protein
MTGGSGEDPRSGEEGDDGEGVAREWQHRQIS